MRRILLLFSSTLARGICIFLDFPLIFQDDLLSRATPFALASDFWRLYGIPLLWVVSFDYEIHTVAICFQLESDSSSMIPALIDATIFRSGFPDCILNASPFGK